MPLYGLADSAVGVSSCVDVARRATGGRQAAPPPPLPRFDVMPAGCGYVPPIASACTCCIVPVLQILLDALEWGSLEKGILKGGASTREGW